MITLSARLWLLLTLLALCFLAAGMLLGVKLMLLVLHHQLPLIPFRRGDVAYMPVYDGITGERYVVGDSRFGRLCVELMHGERVEEIIPLEEIGKLAFLSQAAAQRKLLEEKYDSECI